MFSSSITGISPAVSSLHIASQCSLLLFRFVPPSLQCSLLLFHALHPLALQCSHLLILLVSSIITVQSPAVSCVASFSITEQSRAVSPRFSFVRSFYQLYQHSFNCLHCFRLGFSRFGDECTVVERHANFLCARSQQLRRFASALLYPRLHRFLRCW